MNYVKPDLVLSPKHAISNLRVLYDGGENNWSLAQMDWNGEQAIGLRWNGGTDDPRFSSIGNPQSRGQPTWFILPDEIACLVIDMLKLGKKIQMPLDNAKD